MRAHRLGETSKVNTADKLSPVLVAVFAFVPLHERSNSRECLGVGLVGAGVLLLALKR